MNNSSLVILDVGHGNCAVLLDQKGIVVIDAGPGSSLLEYIVNEKIKKIDTIIISHADKDHIEGVVALLGSKAVEIGAVILNSDALKDSVLWDDLVWMLNKENVAGNLKFGVGLTSNDTGTFNVGNIHIEILAPRAYLAAKGPGANDRQERVITTNSISAIIRLVKDKVPLALLTGDIDTVGLSNIVEDKIDMSAAILVFPHHGGRPGQDDAREFANLLVGQVKPSIVVFSIGRKGQSINPLPEIVSAIYETKPDARILCTQLSRRCTAVVPSENPKHLHPIYARGRETRSCCAGSIVVNLDDPELPILPEVNLHNDFISANTSTALCRK